LRENPDFPRLIIGLHADPAVEVQNGRLLAELYFAASGVTITVPPLRDRLDELPRQELARVKRLLAQ